MSITVLNYLDPAVVEQVNAQALARAEAAKTASLSSEDSFSAALNDASGTGTASDSGSSGTCPAELISVFSEAASTYGVSVSLLTSIAKAESNFNASAVSSAGAVGIMQLMPETAASLGVTDSYDPKQNIMGGAKLISQLLEKYNGDTTLALAAYNAGSANVDKYGGIPPFTETQNYVQKVLSYMDDASDVDALQQISDLLSSGAISSDTLNALVSLLKLAASNGTASSDSTSGDTSSDTAVSVSAASTPSITVTVINGSGDTEEISSIVSDTVEISDVSSETADTSL